MTFWSGERLRDEGPALKIVHGFDTGKIDCSAYTLTLGPEAFVTPDHSASLRDSKKAILAEARDQEIFGIKSRTKGGEVSIPPGQFAILLTEEFVRIPPSVLGFISLKFSIKGTGLVNVSGFHVDPGFQGRLIFSVYNAGPTAINMTRGQDLFLLWLADLDRSSGKDFVKSPPQQITTSIPEDMVARANHRIRSLQQMSDDVDKIQRQLDFIKGVGKLVALAVALASLTIAGVRFFAESPAVSSPVERPESPPSPQPILP